jgi:cell division septum initiation protein DivIVA
MERRHLILLSILILLLAFSGWSYFRPSTESHSSFNNPTHPIASNSKQQLALKAENVLSSIKAETKLATDATSDTPYIITCEFIDENKDVLEEIDEMSDEFDKYVDSTNRLSESLTSKTDTESQLVKVFLSENSNPDDKVNALINILTNSPNNKIASWSLLNTCASESSSKCSKELIAKARNIHHQNAAVWITVITTAHQNSDHAVVQEALEQLIAAPIFNDYYSEYLVVAERVFRNVENGKLNEEQTTALPYLAVQSIPPITGILEFCKMNTMGNDHFANLCLEAGKRMVFSSKTALSKMVGYGVQKHAFASLRNDSAIDELEIQRKQSAYYDSILWKKASSLLKYDPELYDRWFRNLVEFGENEAAKLLIEEAIELSNDESYQPCEVST